MTNSTPPDGPTVEPALIYDAGEHRTHAEHAAEAYDFARRADLFADMASETYKPMSVERRRVADDSRARAQWHATMAVYEAIVSR